MKHIQTFFRFCALVILIALTAASCGGGGSAGPSGQVTLRFWKPFEDSDSMQTLIAAYQQKHSNVRIEYTKKNIADYEEDLVNALADGTGPDIFSINNSWLPKYQSRLAPAPDSVFTFKDYRDTFVPIVVDNFTGSDRKVYGVALAVDSLALYYNKDLLGSSGIGVPPKTWADLERHVQRITKQDKNGYFTRSGIAMGTSSNVNRPSDIVYLLMLQAGAQPWQEDHLSSTFADSVNRNGNRVEAGRQALEFYTSFANPASDNYSWNARSDYSIDAFVNGRAAFLYSYAYTRDTIAQKAPNLNYDIAQVPQYDYDSPTVNYANYFGEVVSKQSKNSAVAWDFLKFISSKDSLDKYYAKQKQPSSRRDLVELQISDPDIGVFANSNLTAKAFYKPDEARMDKIFNSMIDAVILRGVDADDALRQASQQADTLTRLRDN